MFAHAKKTAAYPMPRFAILVLVPFWTRQMQVPVTQLDVLLTTYDQVKTDKGATCALERFGFWRLMLDRPPSVSISAWRHGRAPAEAASQVVRRHAWIIEGKEIMDCTQHRAYGTRTRTRTRT